MNYMPRSPARTRNIYLAACIVAALALPNSAWASRSSDLQSKISAHIDNAVNYENQAAAAESNGDRSGACSAYRNASSEWREAASGYSSLQIETLNDASLDMDSINQNAHTALDHSSADEAAANRNC